MFEFSPLLATGVGAVAAGLTAAILIVWRDLGPVALLTSPRRVALVVALAGGVIAFGLEPTVIETPSPTGRDRLAPTLSLPEPDVPEPAVRVGRPVWEALPIEAPAPPGNPTTSEKAGSAEGRPTARGIDGRIGARNTPTVYDAAFQARLFWDGWARSLEEQALRPIANPIEMGADLGKVVERLMAQSDHVAAFAAAFGAETPIVPDRIAEALAAFERTSITPDAPVDRFVRGDREALTGRQIRGMSLFETIGCVVCHAGPRFSRANLLAPEKGSSALRLFPSLPSPSVENDRLTDDLDAAKAAEARDRGAEAALPVPSTTKRGRWKRTPTKPIRRLGAGPRRGLPPRSCRRAELRAVAVGPARRPAVEARARARSVGPVRHIGRSRFGGR